MCSVCNLQQGPYFCRDPLCFRYFCRACWAWQHRNVSHKQLMRWSKGGSASGSAPRHAPRAAPASPPAQPPHTPLETGYNGYAASCDGTTSPNPSEYEVASVAQTHFESTKLSDKEPWE
ncbi:PREDICTED: uncharacterized protein LOC106102697 [Papilio polytes]|uniref:uncharacterized protein LOC106102697 n=1 Tax=Papilio polytes TaxID=76194 RepID=UPI000675F03C|nr:PREDICTED: uncharacterized protein LOC106102697 [Papilio polytes]